MYTLLASKWLNFDAVLNLPCGVQLNWKISGETPGTRFYIERSLDGRNFTEIGTTSAGNAHYTFEDGHASQLTGIAYYRIRSVDVDGRTGYSKINAVQLCNRIQDWIKIYPTVTEDYVIIEGQNFSTIKKVMISLYDASGNRVMQKREMLFNRTLQLYFDRRYFPGYYILTILNRANGEMIYRGKIKIR
jgi:hypothetical protein